MADVERRRLELAVARAIELGYRLVDTAYNYHNEEGVGRGLRAADVAREQLFVTSKLNGEWHGVKEARQAFEVSRKRLGVEYLDLYLIHWPLPRQDRYVQAFQGLVELLDAGLVRAIGLSNFKPAHIERVLAETGVRRTSIRFSSILGWRGPRRARTTRRTGLPRSRGARSGLVRTCWTSQSCASWRSTTGKRPRRSCCAGTSSWISRPFPSQPILAARRATCRSSIFSSCRKMSSGCQRSTAASKPPSIPDRAGHVTAPTRHASSVGVNLES